MTSKRKMLTCVAASLLAGAAAAAGASIGSRYATDAYPGFDDESHILETEQKEPGFFSWWSGPKMETPADQLEWARECVRNEKWGKACDAYDALVAEWPSAPEAPVAQEELADLLAGKADDVIDAFAEYRYLLDFYSSSCDYDAVVAKLYSTAQRMREEGKTVVFFRFANTRDVRRAFESVVRHAPGASFAPAARLAVGELREEEEDFEEAVLVYEALRNMHPDAPEAKTALLSEARLRIKLLRDHAYNRSRCIETIQFMRSAIAASPRDANARAEFEGYLAEARALIEDEAYAAAKFYDSRTRTRESAINAYERFLHEYPASDRVAEVRERLEVLKAIEARGDTSLPATIEDAELEGGATE